MATVYKPPSQVSGEDEYKFTIFLAGSIEMGKAIDWQSDFTERLSDLDIVILNPRRDDWDSSWEQKHDNPNFWEQVNWEMDNLENCDLATFFFAPGTQSPITLLELGTRTRENKKKSVVCCPEGFWRKGNVDILCIREGIQFVETLDELETVVRKRYNKWKPSVSHKQKFVSPGVDIYGN